MATAQLIHEKDIVQAVEVWTLDHDCNHFKLTSSVYGLNENELASRNESTFEIGTGIVGETAAKMTPVIATNLPEGTYPEFSHVVAVPTIKDNQCQAVTLLFCDEGEDKKGAIEIWRPNERSELSLEEAWHPGLERFGLISKHVKFPRRAGLPGMVWGDRFPRVLGGLSNSQSFVRIAGAKSEGLSTAIGIPFMQNALEIESALLMLSSSQSPIARVMEVWSKDPTTNGYKIVSADYGSYIDLGSTSRNLIHQVGSGVVGKVFAQESPWVTWDLLGVEHPRGDLFSEYGFIWGLGLPIFVGNEFRAVVTLYS